MPRRYLLAIGVLLLFAGTLRADLTLKEKVYRVTEDLESSSLRVISISGTRMRLDEEDLPVTIYDAERARLLRLEPSSGRALVSTADELGEGPAPLTTEWEPVEGAGGTCALYRFAARIPVGEEAILAVTGSARITGRDAQDFVDFHKAAGLAHLILLAPSDGFLGDHALALAVARGRTELYSRIAQAGARPCSLELHYGLERTGVRRLVDKAFSGVLRIEVQDAMSLPLPAALFTTELPEVEDPAWNQPAPPSVGRIHVLGRHLWLGLGAGVSSLVLPGTRETFGAAQAQPVVRFVGPPGPKGFRLNIAPVFKHFSKGPESARLDGVVAGFTGRFARFASDFAPIATVQVGGLFVSQTGSPTHLRPALELGTGLGYKGRAAITVNYERVAPAGAFDFSNWSADLIMRVF
jgi:hypothetical protein